MPGFSLVNANGISKPVNTLVIKISNAFGRHFDPRQKVRMAEAEAQADRILRLSAAETYIEVAELKQRAAARFANEEMTKQINMESIIEKAIPNLDDDANPEEMENDWIMNFFDKCRTVSDDDMQRIWAGILSGEANNPGSFSRRTVNLVADLDKRDAELFRNLCGFAWTIDYVTPLVFDAHADIYNRNGITYESLSHLESLGLIQFGGLSAFRKLVDFSIVGLSKELQAFYYDRPVLLEFPNDSDNKLSIGVIKLTLAGQELASICGSTLVEGFFEYVYDRWAGESLVAPREPRQDDVVL